MLITSFSFNLRREPHNVIYIRSAVESEENNISGSTRLYYRLDSIIVDLMRKNEYRM